MHVFVYKNTFRCHVPGKSLPAAPSHSGNLLQNNFFEKICKRRGWWFVLIIEPPPRRGRTRKIYMKRPFLSRRSMVE
ncbi:hypothetical protein SUBVAR_06947 [Subdoligranulum variabile DSM 15176]|uniref:Uncharacterized protein n=1 Tax=Subdoligranulum variabile DSM 15176 TaxID=411471 RepID=D1PRB8_9FIRM|nr:hypothetical protein SUBVAR_06947 [Subdoligranulum variabile DSM 15176]